MRSNEGSEGKIERVIPGVSPPELVSEHVARYRFVAPMMAEREVLDLGCGAGYGSEILRMAGASGVIAIDIATEAVDHAQRSYSDPGTRYVVGDGRRLPLPDGCVDRVVAFEVLEHVEDWEALVQEVHRVLRENGIFILSTPNRLTYNETRPDGANPFHVHEFDRDELRSLLTRRFSQTLLYEQVFTEGVLIQPEDGSLTRADREIPSLAVFSAESPKGTTGEPDFFIGLCWKRSGARFPAIPGLSYLLHRFPSDPPSGALFLSPNDYLRRLRLELTRRERDLDEKREWALRLARELRLREEELIRLQEDLESKVGWARSLEAEAERRGKRILQLQDELQEKARWAQALNSQRQQLEEMVRGLTQELERLREAPGGRERPARDSRDVR
jgi:SAM-dependent methyltransferase